MLVTEVFVLSLQEARSFVPEKRMERVWEGSCRWGRWLREDVL